MAITTYAELKTAILSWCYSRSDTALTTATDDFIDLVEGDVNNGIAMPDGSVLKLRTRNMETSATLSPNASGQATIPSDFLEVRQVTSLHSPRRDLRLITPAQAEAKYGYRDSDLPDYFTIIGTTLQVLPVSTTNLTFYYYETIDALSDATTSNWLLSRSPNAYLFGALYHAGAWMDDPKFEARYFPRYVAQIAALNAADRGERWSRVEYVADGIRP